MEKLRKNSHRASTLQVALSTGLISIFAILLVIGAPANRRGAPGHDRHWLQLKEGADTLGNYPDTSVPLSGDTTVTPDAAPTNTTSINVSTSTNFKGTLAASPTTGVVRVTDAHPAGAYTVTVTAFGPGGTTTKTFALTVTGNPCGAGLTAGFTNAADVGVGSSPLSVAVGDFNGDGLQDLAVANFYPFRASIRLGNGLGGFSGSTEVSGANPIYSVAIGDFNGDGKQDLALVQYYTSGKVLIRLGDGLGGFSGSTEVAVGTYPVSVAVGDFNSDGKQDFAVANLSSSTISIRLGDGLGGFSGSTEISVGSNPQSVAIGDFNGDGKQDLASAGGSTVSIRLGDGFGGFSGSTNVSVSSPVSVAIGDFNGDGKQDLAVANYGSNTVSIRLGDGLGGFSGSTNVSVGSNPYSVAIGDFNGDGKQDLAVANYNSTDTVSIRLGDGLGNFSGATEVDVGFQPRSVAIGDFNGDGRQDLAVANSGSGTVSIRLGQCVTPPTPTPTPSCALVITQSTSQAITTSLTPCLNPHPTPPGPSHYDNSYWRAFNMADFVGGGGPYYVSGVSFGVSSANNTQPVTVRLYTNAGAPFPGGTRTQIATTTINVTNAQSGTVVTTPLTATVPAGTSELVMELFTPNGASGQHLFYVGANTEPETGQSYWGSCPPSFPPQPTSVHFVFNVYGRCTPPCGTLLYDQTSSAGTTAIVSQNFEAANDGFDSQLADDFVVSAGSVWTVERINVSGTYFNGIGPAASVNVSFYSNSGTLPGAAVPGGTYTNLPMTDTAGSFSIALPTNLLLTSGTYWVSIQANLDFSAGGEWGWLDRTVQSNSPAAWQNPGGGFGFGCLTWGARAATCGIDPAAPDQIFQIVGCVSVPTPTPAPSPTPTPTPTSTPTPTPTPPCGVISHSTSQAITTPAPLCQKPPPMAFPYDNYYWRAFNMQSFVGGAEYTVSSVSFGVFLPSATVTVRLYANNGAPFPAGTGTQIGTSTLTVTSGGGTVVTTPLVATVPAGTNELVMELYVPKGSSFFRAGANSAPETGPSYWNSTDIPGCPSTPQVISAHLVFNVYGTCPAPTPTPSPGICGTLLYDQTSSAGTSAIVSQNFEPGNDGFDSQLADDFVVPAGPVWTVQRVNVNGVYFNGPGPAASVNVTFYFNSGTLPGAAVPGGTYTNLPVTDTAGNFSIPLPTNLVLSPGAYWVSVQANMDFSAGGEWGWLDRTVQSNSPAAWQNPGGGFGFGCLTWGARAATCGLDATAPDQIFQIVGCLGAPSPTPSPTPTPIAISGTISYCSNPVPGPVPNVTLTLTGSMSGSTLSNGSGNYQFSSLPSGGSYTVTPSKATRLPGSAGIDTVDVVATQRHFLNLGTPLSGCRLTAADVNGDSAVNTVDVVAMQRFFLGLSTGIANVGKYKFTPMNRTYTGITSNQTSQNYDALAFGDVASPFAEP